MTISEVLIVLNSDRLRIKEEETCNTLYDQYCDMVTGEFYMPKELLDREVSSLGVGLDVDQIVLWVKRGERI